MSSRRQGKIVSKVINCRLLLGEGKEALYTVSFKGRKISAVARQLSRTVAWRSKGVVDAGERVVLPGMIDCHTHLFAYALRDLTVDLRGSSSIRDLRERLANFVRQKNNLDRGWIIGRGWDQDLFEERRLPDRNDLDDSIQDRPVLLERVCGHIGVMNSTALQELRSALKGLPRELLPIDGTGRPSGIVKESALDRVRERLPAPSVPLLTKSLHKIQNDLLRKGLVSVHCILSSNWEKELDAVRTLDARDELVVGMSLFLPISALSYAESALARNKGDNKKKEHLKLTGKNFAVLGFKLFADGSLGARTAALDLPYSDDPSNSGMLYYNQEQISEYAGRIKSLGLILCCHAIGDRAIKQVLNAYASAGIRRRDGFRIEHCSIAGEEIIRKLGTPILSVQPSFATSDYWLQDRIGEDRKKKAYRLKSLSRKNLVVGGSDSPVENIDPLSGICSAMTNPLEKERLSVFEAAKLYSSNASKVSNLTKVNGKIKKNYAADLVILNVSTFEKLCEASPMLVIHSGRLVKQMT